MRAVLLALSLFCVSAFGAEAVLNRDFLILKPAQRPQTPGRVEVIEFFSYGCPHCADLHPRLEKWLTTLPKDAVFKRVPVGFGRPAWSNLARAYYALEATGDLHRLDGALYEAVHRRGLPLVDEASITDWVAKQGADRARFAAAYNSFSVVSKVGQADELTRQYRVFAVPTFTVGGRYAVIARSEEQTLDTAHQLIARARKEGAATLR